MMRTAPRLTAILAMTIALQLALAQERGFAQFDSTVCHLAPRTLPLWDGTPAAIVASTPIPPVSTVDEDTIRAAIIEIVSCINSGEPRLIFAIFTDRYLAERYADPTKAYLPEFEQRLARNILEPSGQFTLENVSDIALMADGRVSVNIVLSATGVRYRDTLVLAKQHDLWLIDGVTLLDPPM